MFLRNTFRSRKKFLSKIFVSVTRLLQITKTHTTAYRPRSNGQVERSNRTLLQMMRCLRDKNISEWDEYIPQIASAMRAMVNRDTGFTPNMLMLGHVVFRPVDIMYGVSQQNKSFDTPPEYVKKLSEIMRRSHHIARETLKSNLRRQKRTYDKKLYEYMYNSGDLVYLLNCAGEVGMSRKLRPIYKGPYLITKVISPSLYRIADRKNSFVVHHDRLMLCDDHYIPFGMRKMRHEFLNLEETMPYDDEEFDPQDPLNRGLLGILSYLFQQEVPPVASTSSQMPEQIPTADTPVPKVSTPVSVSSTDSDDIDASRVPIPDDINSTMISSDISEKHAQLPPDVGTISDTSDMKRTPDEPVPHVTRRGRVVKKHPKFRDYILDS